MVIGKGCRPDEGAFGTGTDRQIGNFSIFGRYDDPFDWPSQSSFSSRYDPFETGSALCGTDGPFDHRDAAKRPDILARDTFRAAPGRDDADPSVHCRAPFLSQMHRLGKARLNMAMAGGEVTGLHLCRLLLRVRVNTVPS